MLYEVMPDLSRKELEARVLELEEQIYGSVMKTPDEFDYGPHDHSGESLNPESVNTEQATTVSGDDLAAVQEAVANHTPVLLEQGKTYTGDTTVKIPHGTAVYAHGSTIDYTGNGIAIDTEQGNYGSSTPYEIVEWYGGRIVGNPDATDGFRSHDSYGSIVRPQEVRKFENGNGVHIENSTAWSEYVRVVGTTFRENGTHIRFSRATGNESGTSSFKATVLRDLHLGPTASGGVGISILGGVYDSEIRNIRGNSGPGGTMIRIYSAATMKGTTIERVVTETQGNKDVTMIKIDDINNSNSMPIVGNLHFSDPTGTLTEIENNSGHGLNQHDLYAGAFGDEFDFGSGGGNVTSIGQNVPIGANGTKTVTFTNFDTQRRGGLLAVSVGETQRRGGALYHIEHFSGYRSAENKISEVDTGGFVSIGGVSLNSNGDLEITVTETSGYSRDWTVRAAYLGVQF